MRRPAQLADLTLAFSLDEPSIRHHCGGRVAWLNDAKGAHYICTRCPFAWKRSVLDRMESVEFAARFYVSEPEPAGMPRLVWVVTGKSMHTALEGA